MAAEYMEVTRQAYRSRIFAYTELGEFVSGVILF